MPEGLISRAKRAITPNKKPDPVQPRRVAGWVDPAADPFGRDPVVYDGVIERRAVNPDGSVTVYRFSPEHGQSTEVIPAPASGDPADAAFLSRRSSEPWTAAERAERLSVEMQLRGISS